MHMGQATRSWTQSQHEEAMQRRKFVEGISLLVKRASEAARNHMTVVCDLVKSAASDHAEFGASTEVKSLISHANATQRTLVGCV